MQSGRVQAIPNLHGVDAAVVELGAGAALWLGVCFWDVPRTKRV